MKADVRMRIMIVTMSRRHAYGTPNERGQVMLELLLVFPLVILLLMSFVQVTEIVAAGMGVEWAARQSARAAAVHPQSAQKVATTVALRTLAPHLPPIPLLETPVRAGDMPLVQSLESVVDVDMPDPNTLPGMLADVESAMPVWLVWVTRAFLYEQIGEQVSGGSGDQIAGATGFHPRPVVAETRVRLQNSGDNLTIVDGPLTEEALVEARGRGDVTVTIRFQYPLRIPLAKKFFDNSGIRGFPAHRIERSASFPIMYSPGEQEEAVN